MIKREIPWIEKYRPKTIDSLIADESTKTKIKNIIKDKEMPNIIITGIPGTGKTSTIVCLTKSILGKHFKEGVLELNASDDRGIRASDTIITFCKKKFNINKPNEKKYSNHKMILLDEADNMTNKAQQVINNMMEKYNSTTRFAFTCNNSTKIIESIQSKCIILRYKRLSKDQIYSRLEDICKNENIDYTKDGLNSIVLTSLGDMRQAINNLQLTYNTYEKINIKNVTNICEKPQPDILKKILLLCSKNNLSESIKNIYEIKNNGFSSADIIMSMLNVLKYDEFKELEINTKMKYYKIIGKTALKISLGLNSIIQLTGCISELIESN